MLQNTNKEQMIGIIADLVNGADHVKSFSCVVLQQP